MRIAALSIASIGVAAPPPNPIEAEVRANILADKAGSVTAAALGLHPEFVARVADHIITESYIERHRAVVPDGTKWPPPARPTDSSPGSAPTPIWLRLVPSPQVDRNRPPPSTQPYPEAMPDARGFHMLHYPTELGGPFGQIDPRRPNDAAVPAVRADVGARLAPEGLLNTTRRALATLPPELVAPEDSRIRTLWEVGVPADLLRHFTDPTLAGTDLINAIAHVSDRLRLAPVDFSAANSGESQAVAPEMSFHPVPADSSWLPRLDCGEEPIALLRMQMPRGDYWLGPNAGGAVDVLRQLVEHGAAPHIAAIIPAGGEGEKLRRIGAEWKRPAGVTVDLLAGAGPVDQWARDNGRAGTILRDGRRVPATLVPRYPNRSEHVAKLAFSDLAAIRRFADAGHALVPSSLLFQGGNLLAYRNPSSGRLHVLVGEAEIARNVALGLSEAQVRALFSCEFGGAEVTVLPAVGFHLDLEISIRREGERLIAFVNDPHAAALLVIRCAIPALQSAGLLDSTQVDALRKALESNDIPTLLGTLLPRLHPAQSGPGQWPLKLTMPFATSPVDSPVGNFQRYLYALDLLLAEKLELQTVANDPFTQAYYGALQRRSAGRAALRSTLQQLGFEVVPIPGWAEARVSMAGVNAVQTPDAVWLSTYGGLYAPVDAAAIDAVCRAVKPGTRVIGILSGESQCRFGGVHCSVMEY